MTLPKINIFSKTFSFPIERIRIQLTPLQKKVAMIALAMIGCMILAASFKMIKDFYYKKPHEGDSSHKPTNEEQKPTKNNSKNSFGSIKSSTIEAHLSDTTSSLEENPSEGLGDKPNLVEKQISSHLQPSTILEDLPSSNGESTALEDVPSNSLDPQLFDLPEHIIFHPDIFDHKIAQFLKDRIDNKEEFVRNLRKTCEGPYNTKEQAKELAFSIYYTKKYQNWLNLRCTSKYFYRQFFKNFKLKRWDPTLFYEKKFKYAIEENILIPIFKENRCNTSVWYPNTNIPMIRKINGCSCLMTFPHNEIKQILSNIHFQNIKTSEKEKNSKTEKLSPLISFHHGQFFSSLNTLVSVPQKQFNYCQFIEQKLPFPSNSLLPCEIQQQEDFFQRYSNDKLYAQEINLRLIYDEFYDAQEIEKTVQLKKRIETNPSGYEGNIYVYANHTPAEIFLLLYYNDFYIPSFLSGITQMYNLQANDCPIKPYSESTNNLKGAFFNVIYEIQVDSSNCVAYIDPETEQDTRKTCLIPCYSHFKYIKRREENGLFIITLKMTNGQDHSPLNFDTLYKWMEKRALAQFNTWDSQMTIRQLDNLCENFHTRINSDLKL